MMLNINQMREFVLWYDRHVAEGDISYMRPVTSSELVKAWKDIPYGALQLDVVRSFEHELLIVEGLITACPAGDYEGQARLRSVLEWEQGRLADAIIESPYLRGEAYETRLPEAAE